MAFSIEDPNEQIRADYRAAIICQTFVMVMTDPKDRKKIPPLKDFLLKFRKAEDAAKEQEEDMKIGLQNKHYLKLILGKEPERGRSRSDRHLHSRR